MDRGPIVLIVNADDLGLSPSINAGIAKAYDEGIVTSASLMVRGTAAAEAAELTSARLRMSVGLHVDLGEWVYGPDGWFERYRVVDVDDAAAVEREIRSQIDAFARLIGRPPTHLDGHQHVQRTEPVAAAMLSAGAELGVPVRLLDSPVVYRGEFYGHDHRGEPYPDGIDPATLVDLIASLPPGWSEIGCHPGIGVERSTSVYAAEREVEVAALTDPAVRRAIVEREVVLASFADIDRDAC